MERLFSRIASATARWAGKPISFIVSCLAVIAWALSGPMFGWSDTWQLVINTATTVLTFLMVFVIQNSQNRDGLAIQAKLDELIRVTESARDDLMRAETRTETEIDALRG